MCLTFSSFRHRQLLHTNDKVFFSRYLEMQVTVVRNAHKQPQLKFELGLLIPFILYVNQTANSYFSEIWHLFRNSFLSLTVFKFDRFPVSFCMYVLFSLKTYLRSGVVMLSQMFYFFDRGRNGRRT